MHYNNVPTHMFICPYMIIQGYQHEDYYYKFTWQIDYTTLLIMESPLLIQSHPPHTCTHDAPMQVYRYRATTSNSTISLLWSVHYSRTCIVTCDHANEWLDSSRCAGIYAGIILELIASRYYSGIIRKNWVMYVATHFSNDMEAK